MADRTLVCIIGHSYGKLLERFFLQNSVFEKPRDSHGHWISGGTLYLPPLIYTEGGHVAIFLLFCVYILPGDLKKCSGVYN